MKTALKKKMFLVLTLLQTMLKDPLKQRKEQVPDKKAQALLEDTLEAIERGDEKTFQSLFAELHGKNFSKKKGPQERKM